MAMIIIYNALLYVAGLLILPLVVIVLIFSKKWRNGFGERLGRLDAKIETAAREAKIIWFHAASVGEVMALAPVIKEMKKIRRGYDILLTTTSVNGKKRAQKELSAELLHACLLPVDVDFIISSFIKKINPEMIVIMETELWPNLIYHAGEGKIPLLLINGRISERSFGLYYAFRFFFRYFLEKFTLIIMQSEKMVMKLRKVGFRGKKVMFMHNIKYSSEPGADELMRIKITDKRGKQLVIAGSIRKGEEEVVIKAFKRIPPGTAVLVFAPRHMNRKHVVAAMLAKERMKYAFFSKLKKHQDMLDYEAVILDTIGDLKHMYMAGDIAIVGGGFNKAGGHNPMEPAAAGLPVITGENMFNFEDTMDKLCSEGGAIKVPADEAALYELLLGLLSDRGRRLKMGEVNKNVMEKLRGSAETTAMIINEVLLEKKN
jgi:3-deoxy-D-manno-octulosonic-acid transferase